MLSTLLGLLRHPLASPSWQPQAVVTPAPHFMQERTTDAKLMEDASAYGKQRGETSENETCKVPQDLEIPLLDIYPKELEAGI